MRTSKIFALLIAMSLLLTVTFTCACESTAIIYGDADTDTNVTIMDATTIQQALAKIITLTKEQEKCALVTGNDTVSIMDATLIQQYIAKIIDKFPAEESNVTDKETITKCL